MELQWTAGPADRELEGGQHRTANHHRPRQHPKVQTRNCQLANPTLPLMLCAPAAPTKTKTKHCTGGQHPRARARGGLAGMQWKGGGYPPPLQGAQPMPSDCPPDAKCQLQWHL